MRECLEFKQREKESLLQGIDLASGFYEHTKFLQTRAVQSNWEVGANGRKTDHWPNLFKSDSNLKIQSMIIFWIEVEKDMTFDWSTQK